MLDLSGLDDGHLSALVRALHQARFCEVEDDPIVFASPLVADLHTWALEEQQRRRPVDPEQYAAWLNWEGRHERVTVMRRLREQADLRRLVLADPSVLREILRPFSVDDETLRQMIGEAREF